MKKTITLFSIVALIGYQSVWGQDVSSPAHRPTYHELKAAGLLGNYTEQQIIELAREEVRPVGEQVYNPEPLNRSVDPGNSIQTSSPYFTISPVNPAICSGQTSTLSAPTILSSSSGLVVSDDWYSSAINIGFSFTFYGTTYTQFVVGTNGCLN